MDILAVILIIAIAGLYLARRFYKGLKKSPSCCCGSCGQDCVEKNISCHPDES